MVLYTSISFGLAFAALLVCMTNVLYTVLDGHTKKPQNRVYIALLVILGINAACDLVNFRFNGIKMDSDSAFMTMKAAQYIYFLTHNLSAPLFYYYISFVVGRSVRFGLPRKQGRTTVGYVWNTVQPFIVVITAVIVAFNPLTHWCWYYDEARNFHRAWGEYVFLYSISALWLIGAFILAMMSWNILSKTRKRSIAICFLLAGAGIITQLISTTYRIEVLMEAIGFTGVLLFIENEDDRKNVELNTYNSAAFTLDMNATLKNHLPVQVLIVRNIRFEHTANRTASGRVSREAIIHEVAAYLGTVVKPYYIYSIGLGRFALMLYNYSDEETKKLAETIDARFREPWKIKGADRVFSAKLMLVRVPERAKTVQEILYIAECPIPEHVQTHIFEGSELDWIIRRASVEDAVSSGLAKGSFEVYYQPTYNIDKTLHGAEALLRMHDSKIGWVYPDEFIPIAEQLGMIDALDEFVLKEVCKFIMTGIPQKYGMDCINVNLSVLECMKDGFAEHISGIVEAEGVHKKHINFEITESVAAKDYGHLSNVIDQLKKEGFKFSIDDYGTGYSNMTSLFSLGADIIKIDKSILWNAEKSELGMTLLKTSIEMVHQMQKKSLMEGVETEDQLQILKKLSCDYLQGYYFSKPLPKSEFVSLIESNRIDS